MKPGRVEGEFGEQYYDVMIRRVAMQPALVGSREHPVTQTASLQRFSQYEQNFRSRLTHVIKPVGRDIAREHHMTRHGNKRG